jgi:hypothetical protein
LGLYVEMNQINDEWIHVVRNVGGPVRTRSYPAVGGKYFRLLQVLSTISMGKQDSFRFSEDMVILLTLGIAPYISAHFKLLFYIGESQACFASCFSNVVSIVDGREANGETC